MRPQAADDGAPRGRPQRAPARAAYLRSALTIAFTGAAALAGCNVDPGTTAYAHESGGFDPPGPDSADSLDNLQYLQRSRYLGGNGSDPVEDLADVSAGTTVIVGSTSSTDFPVTDGSTLDATVPSGCVRCPSDATVTLVNNATGAIQWARLLGGVGHDRAVAAIADANGIYIAGSTAGGIATTAGAGDRTFAGGTTSEYGAEDGFVCRLDAATGATTWCSYVGGSGPGGVTDVAVRGDVYVTLITTAGENLQADPDYTPAFANGLRSTPQGADGVIVQLAAADGHFVSATYVGGSGDESGPASLVADGGYIHYLGGTASTDVPTPGGFLTTAPAGANLFFTTFSPGLGAMQYGTYIGGDGDDTTDGDALAGWNDTAEVVGIGITTTSRTLPTRLGIAQASYGGDGNATCGNGDAWLAVIRPTMNGDASLLSATYLGGSAGEYVGGVSAIIGSRALLAVAGRTSSSNFPTTRGARTVWNGPTCEMAGGPPEAYVALVDVDTGAHAATFLGGAQSDRVAGITGTHVVGVTSSIDFPATTPPGDTTLDGEWDGFFTEFGAFPLPVNPPDGGTGSTDAGSDADPPHGDYGAPNEGGGPSIGCCGAAPAPVAPGTFALGALVMLLVRRRRVR